MAKISNFYLVTLILIGITTCYKPIIGVYGNPYPENDFAGNAHDYVDGTYVRWIQESGGEVIALHPWHSDEELDDILSKINGVLFQGGDRDLNLTMPWERIADRILRRTIELYETKKEVFPIWGTCQGFQMTHMLLSNDYVLDRYKDRNYLHEAIFNSKTRKARMHSLFSKKDFDMLEKQNSTIYFHYLGINNKTHEQYKELERVLDVTSLGVDIEQKEFVNSIEGKNGIPIYGTQYHPEKNPYDRIFYYSLKHEADGRKISQLFSLFFISEARKSPNRLPQAERSKYDFISSYSMGKADAYEENIYYFSKKQFPQF